MVARCTHENALFEELEALAEWCGEQRKAWLREARFRDVVRAAAKVSAYSAAETHIRERIATLRAQRAPIKYTEG